MQSGGHVSPLLIAIGSFSAPWRNNMPVDPNLKEQVRLSLAPPADVEALSHLLLEHSKLPGPRANLELIDELTNASAGRPDLIAVYSGWLAIESGPNDPPVFLPTCAAAALGSIFPGASPRERGEIISALASAANDTRWRVREGVAMGLQRIGKASFPELETILLSWIQSGTLLEWRAVVAALAEPALLRDSSAATTAAELATEVADQTVATPISDRKTEEFKVLKQGLSYALSVIVAACPAEGFALLERLAATGDPDAIAIVKANLDKPRLTKSFPDEVAGIRALL
jgi:hypothetical protein